MRIKFKGCSLILCIIFMFLSSCQKRSEQIYQLYTSNPENILQNADISITDTSGGDGQEAIDETSGELTICAPYTDWDISNGWLIPEFNKQYPNIKVTVNCLDGDYTALSEAATKVSVVLMSGSAGDIVDLTGMPGMQYAKNNLLEDLYPYMENDPDFHKEDYYTNIIQANEYQNKLYIMPIDFYYWCVRFNKMLLDKNQMEAPEGDSINYQQILDIYHKIDPSNNKLILSHYCDSSIIEEVESIRYLDAKNDKADYNSPGYIDFLNDLNSILWPSAQEIELARQNNGGKDESFGGPAENDLCFFAGSFYQEEKTAKLFYDSPNLTLPIPLTATNGDKGFMENDMTLGIISSSKNKDLAWKFIRFCIEEKPVDLITNFDRWRMVYVPINRNNELKMLEAQFGEGHEEAVQMIDRWNSERNEPCEYVNTFVLLEAKYYIQEDFFCGRISAEECARQIQERMDIYMKE